MKTFYFNFSGMLLMVAMIAISSFDVQAHQNIVLFDEGHGQKFLAERNGELDLSELSTLLRDEGLQVKTSKGEITDKVLADAKALIISGAFDPFTHSEIAAIINFVNNGGNLCIMLHIGFPVTTLLSKLNVYVSKGVVREQENIIHQNDLDYYVTAPSRHELVEDIERFKVFGGWALVTKNEHSEIIGHTSPKAWLDTNMNSKRDPGERERPLGLAVVGKLGDGNFVVFGDDAIFQNRFLSEENLQLGKNLAKWLKGSKLDPPVKKLSD